MDPFTQRMLARARARQEKIDQKLVNSGQAVPKRIPLSENCSVVKSNDSPIISPRRGSRDTILSPKKSLKESNGQSPRKNVNKFEKSNPTTVASPQRARNDFIVTRQEFKSPSKASRRNSDVSVEINIMHRDDVQIEVQVEEREAPISVTYDSTSGSGSSVSIKEIEGPSSKETMNSKGTDSGVDRGGLRHNMKSRLDRLGNLYSDEPNLSSPIHRTEQDFSSATPPNAATRQREQDRQQERPAGKKFERLAVLANTINHWEDDYSHHAYQSEPTSKQFKLKAKHDVMNDSSVDVSIHSIKDINNVLSSTTKFKKNCSVNTRTFTKTNECLRLDEKILAELEGEGYRRVSASQSRLVYDFTTTESADPARQEPKHASTTTTPSAAAAPNMATMVAAPPSTITKKPSIKKYKAPTPPRKIEVECDKDKENNEVQTDDDHNDETDCIQTKPADDKPTGSPVVKRLAPKLNGNVDRSSVLSKAAMFETGSPKAKDPAEMSLRERKALFEKNKGAAIVPKAPFGLAPSLKTLHGVKDKKPASKPSTPTKPSVDHSRTNSTDNLNGDNVSQTSLGKGIKGALNALFNKEQTISETTIANKNKQEREREMEMLQNRFNKPQPEVNQADPDSEDDQNDPSENAPLMGSTVSLPQGVRKPEIVANVPKSIHPEDKEEGREDKVVGSQPVKRRSSQDSPVVLSVIEEVKRIKVNKKEHTNGAVLQQPASLYPHLSDIETDTSNAHEEYQDCGGSSSEDIPNKLNKSDNWSNTSFGREVMNVVKKNNTSYNLAVREGSDESQSACDSELDDMLDEALDADSEGPTPPKQNKNAALASNSFVYQEKRFKSPLKSEPATPAARPDRFNELVHSVSFYRRMQSASSKPSTPLRMIRHASPDREADTPGEASAAVTTVKQRIHDLQAEVNKQQTVISQASQALNLCASTIEFSGSTEQAEGERLLLLATHRRQACLHEIQRLQVEGAGEAAEAGIVSLHITALRVPLRRDYMRQLNADGAVGHHAVCLLKCRDRVLASSMQLSQPAACQLLFPDEVRMDGLNSDFMITVEIYLLQATKEVLPHDIKYHINNKKSSSKLLTPKSKVSELKAPRVQSPGGPWSVRSPQFQLHGYCIFALSQLSRSSFTLSKVPAASPLEGVLNVEMSSRVKVRAPAPHAAFLTAFDDVSGLGAWHRRWFRLAADRLSYWKYPDDVHKKLPIGDIDLTQVTSATVTKTPRDLCARPNTLLFETSVPEGLEVPTNGSLVYVRGEDGSVRRRHLLAADTQRERDEWLQLLNKALEYVRCTQHQ